MIYIGSDHGGFDLKKVIINHLESLGEDCCDMGTFSKDSVDYPNIAKEVCSKVAAGDNIGILLCGTGVGMSIAANKVSGIRAVCATDPLSVRMSKRHNNANVLCLGQRVIGNDLAVLLLDEFLNNQFEGGRHERRVNLISELEN